MESCPLLLNGGIGGLNAVHVVPGGRLRAVDIVRPVADSDNLIESGKGRTGDGHPTAKVVADVKDPTVEGGVGVVAHRAVQTAEGEPTGKGLKRG